MTDADPSDELPYEPLDCIDFSILASERDGTRRSFSAIPRVANRCGNARSNVRSPECRRQQPPTAAPVTARPASTAPDRTDPPAPQPLDRDEMARLCLWMLKSYKCE